MVIPGNEEKSLSSLNGSLDNFFQCNWIEIVKIADCKSECFIFATLI